MGPLQTFGGAEGSPTEGPYFQKYKITGPAIGSAHIIGTSQWFVTAPALQWCAGGEYLPVLGPNVTVGPLTGNPPTPPNPTNTYWTVQVTVYPDGTFAFGIAEQSDSSPGACTGYKIPST
jgi:hypothetical protein